MFTSKYLAAIILVYILTSCSGSLQKVNYGVQRFVFDFEGKSYTIFSYTPEDKVGQNMLVSTDDKLSPLSARDLYQDGTLDSVLTGPLSLSRAERIYQAGLDYAKLKGNLINRDIKRKYQTEDARYIYLIRTIMPIIGDTYNTFTVTEKKTFPKTLVTKDLFSDGFLDEILSGKGNLDNLQILYEHILEQGISENIFDRKESAYYVSRN